MKKLRGNDLMERGWMQGKILGTAIRNGTAFMKQLTKTGLSEQEALEAVVVVLDDVFKYPERWVVNLSDGEEIALDFTETAKALIEDRRQPEVIQLRDEPLPVPVWGRDLVSDESIAQITKAAQLPVTRALALMPDAHVGYGLPIGGVAALENAIAPYMVGSDIGCRMQVTIYSEQPELLDTSKEIFLEALRENTFFGREVPTKGADHPILEDSRWAMLPKSLRHLQAKAAEQLGSSGSGNHFVEFVDLNLQANNPLGLEAGRYIALVTHSGSRKVGYDIADYYTKMAQKACSTLPKEYLKLAYLNYSAGEGAEYELAMQLAGDFAKACHGVIHNRIAQWLSADVVGSIDNHHNFAWKIGDMFIHRKGATPAHAGALGVIPGSMATPGFLVEGVGMQYDEVMSSPSLNSASHGSGRVMGRAQAKREINKTYVAQLLKDRGVTVIGAGLDESPDAYKDPHKVLAAQTDLVRTFGEFMPRIVRMADDEGRRVYGGKKKKK